MKISTVKKYVDWVTKKLTIYTAVAKHPCIFGADPRLECYQQNYVNLQFQAVSNTTIRSDCFKVLENKKNKLIIELCEKNLLSHTFLICEKIGITFIIMF